MIFSSLEDVKMSYFHNGRTPYFRIEEAGRLHIAPMDDAAALAGVSRQPPPIPCAEIIPFPAAKKSPA